MRLFNSTSMLLEEKELSDEEFEKRTILNLASSAFFMIAGPLFIYYGFYILTSPLTVKWGALSIAIGLLLLMFGFSQWQDRQIQSLRRLLKKENNEIRDLIRKAMESRE